MNKPKITVCIPAYNRPELLREALEGLCDQGLNRNEYVVAIADDASPAPLDEVISCFEEKLQIVYRRNCTNIGHIANFEKSLSLARTPYISFLPDDDLIAPGQLKRALSALHDHPGAVLVASLILCQRYPGALDTSLHGIFLRGSSRANYSAPYVWDRVEWMALALVNTPLSMIGSVFHAETLSKCQNWKSFPLWHDRLMLAEMALHGGVISLPWIGGYNRLSDLQLNAQLAKTNINEFHETSKLILHLCKSINIPVIEFWIEQICEADSGERILYLRMLNGALPGEIFKSIKGECEQRLRTRLHLGWRLDRFGVPRPVAELLRGIDRRLLVRFGGS